MNELNVWYEDEMKIESGKWKTRNGWIECHNMGEMRVNQYRLDCKSRNGWMEWLFVQTRLTLVAQNQRLIVRMTKIFITEVSTSTWLDMNKHEKSWHNSGECLRTKMIKCQQRSRGRIYVMCKVNGRNERLFEWLT